MSSTGFGTTGRPGRASTSCRRLPTRRSRRGGPGCCSAVAAPARRGRARSGCVRSRVAYRPEMGGMPPRIALVGETLADARSVMVEGVSGLLAVHRHAERPVFESSKHQLVWPNGVIAQMFSSEDPDGLRGPQFHAAWCDELAKWTYAERTWDMLQFALRLGEHPRQLVTTTPRPIPLLKRLIEDAANGDRPCPHDRQRGQPGADLRRGDDAALRRQSARPAGARRRDDRGRRQARCGGSTGSSRPACEQRPS